jgi:hypothetical protein
MDIFINIIIIFVLWFGGALFLNKVISAGCIHMSNSFGLGVVPRPGIGINASRKEQPVKFWFFICVTAFVCFGIGLGLVLRQWNLWF